ncbi:MAG: NblA/ycf18 family protein [Scytonema sp. PMC 1069.18]|nr:NblA/ycf18 family protein [Scytonema sp. PMC 1069.18]MEC4882116.1 NblA/ycf18 family protein [Scytonema sp. PMC 1070.18]
MLRLKPLAQAAVVQLWLEKEIITRRLIVDSTELTLEQQLKLTILEKHIQGLSQEQAQKLLLKAVQQMMIKDNIISSLTQRVHIGFVETSSPIPLVHCGVSIDKVMQPKASP